MLISFRPLTGRKVSEQAQESEKELEADISFRPLTGSKVSER